MTTTLPSGAHGPDTGHFNLQTGAFDGQVVLRLAGELDVDTAPSLRKALDDLGERPVATLVLEMTDLTFIDSTGLHEIVVALKRQSATGGEVVLRNPTPQTRRILDIVGLSEMLTII